MPTNKYYPAAAPMDADLFAKLIERFNGWAPYEDGETPSPAHYVGFAEYAGIPMEELAGYLSGERPIPQVVALLAATSNRLITNGLGEGAMDDFDPTPDLGRAERGLAGAALRAKRVENPSVPEFDAQECYEYALAESDQTALELGERLAVAIVGYKVGIVYVRRGEKRILVLETDNVRAYRSDTVRHALQMISQSVLGNEQRYAA